MSLLQRLSGRQRNNFLPALIISCIVLLGVSLRFYKIGERSLHGDAVLTLNIISATHISEIWQNVSDNFRPDFPLFYILLHFWSLVSDNIVWLRAFSAICGALSIVVTYRFCAYLKRFRQ